MRWRRAGRGHPARSPSAVGRRRGLLLDVKRNVELAAMLANLTARQSQSSTGQIVLNNPKLWSLEKPQRYVIVTSVSQDGKVVDTYETPFGIRTIEFTG